MQKVQNKTNQNTKKNIKLNNNPFDFTLCITVLILLALGIVMVLSASSPSALAIEGDSYAYVKKQAISAVLGLTLMFIISKIDYRKYKKYYKIAYIVSIILLILVVVPGIGKKVNGATRWIKIGIQFQPSEIAKIGLIVFYAAYFSINKEKLKGITNTFWKPIAYLIPPILILILLQDHLSASVVIVGVISVMMLVAGTKLIYFITMGGALGVAGATGLAVMAKLTGKGAFRLARLAIFLDPWKDKTGDGWQIIQSLYAIGSGGLFGVGLGESKQKYLYISEPHNDFIFAVLAEELGFVGCVAVIILFAIFIWRGILIAMRAPDTFGGLLAVGITSLIGIQAVINIAVVTASMPVTGVALPFFSYGGTSLVILLCCVGVLLNISRAGKKV